MIELVNYRCGDCGGDLWMDDAAPVRRVRCQDCRRLVGVVYPVGSAENTEADSQSGLLDEDLERELHAAPTIEQIGRFVPIDMRLSEQLGIDFREPEPPEVVEP